MENIFEVKKKAMSLSCSLLNIWISELIAQYMRDHELTAFALPLDANSKQQKVEVVYYLSLCNYFNKHYPVGQTVNWRLTEWHPFELMHVSCKATLRHNGPLCGFLERRDWVSICPEFLEYIAYYTTFTHPKHGPQYSVSRTKKELLGWLSYMVYAHEIDNIKMYYGGRRAENGDIEGGESFTAKIPKY